MFYILLLFQHYTFLYKHFSTSNYPLYEYLNIIMILELDEGTTTKQFSSQKTNSNKILLIIKYIIYTLSYPVFLTLSIITYFTPTVPIYNNTCKISSYLYTVSRFLYLQFYYHIVCLCVPVRTYGYEYIVIGFLYYYKGVVYSCHVHPTTSLGICDQCGHNEYQDSQVKI